MEVSEVQPDVRVIKLGERQITLIGTAHISPNSVETVRETLSGSSPDSVCVELCISRLQNLDNPDKWKQTDLFQVIKRNQGYLLMVQLIISAFQRRLGKQMGVKPGDEMRIAVDLARERTLPVSPIDRDIKTTMKRAWAGSSFFSLLKIVAALGGSMFTREKISEEQLDELKSKDVLTAALSELSGILPGVKRSLIDERDQYMAAKILNTPGNNLLAVVGAGHVPGILRHLETGATDVSELEVVAARSGYFGRIFNYLLLAVGLSIVALLFYVIGVKNTFLAFGTWTIVNGLFAAAASALCLAHPLTIIITFFASPVAAIHPGFAVGWISALAEAYLRKPRVQDFEDLVESERFSLKLLNNRVARILLLLVLPNLGSILGTLVAIYVLSSAVPS